MDARGGGRRRPAGAGPAAGRRPPRALPAHPVLPEAVPLLLLPRVHRQERQRGDGVPRPAGPGVGALRHPAGHRGAPPAVRVLRGRHAVVPVGPAAPRARRPALGGDPVDRSRGDHLRVRAGHAHRVEAGPDPRAGGHPPQPRHRALRRPHPRAERPRPPVGRGVPGLPLRAVPGLPPDQHRPNRGHARRRRREVAGGGRADHRARPRQRHHLPDGAALEHHHQPRPSREDRAVHGGGGGLADEAALGGRGVRGARERRLHRRQRLHRGQEPRRDPVRLPRPALAGGRPRAAGGRLVRTRQRRPHAELRRLGDATRPPSSGAKSP